MQHETKRARAALSVIVITRDEEERIGACLDSVRDLADEIVVLDSGSTDGTLEIVAQYTDRYFSTDWPGYGIQKQRALEKASCEWILSIDADEALDEEMQSWLAHFLAEATADVAGAFLPWGVTVFGKRLDYGRSARAPLRLVRREGASFSNVQVHEELSAPSGQPAAYLEFCGNPAKNPQFLKSEFFNTISPEQSPVRSRRTSAYDSYLENQHKTEILRRWFREEVLRYRTSQPVPEYEAFSKSTVEKGLKATLA